MNLEVRAGSKNVYKGVNGALKDIRHLFVSAGANDMKSSPAFVGATHRHSADGMK
jgi:hypothetical protein